MDEQTKKEAYEYLITLPKGVQKLVFDKIWPQRIKEIAQKYILSPDQAVILESRALFVITGMEFTEDLSEDLITDLGASPFVVTQILDELNGRVFEYALKQTQGKDENIQSQETNEAGTNNSTALETAPGMLPMVEEGEEAQDAPRSAEVATPLPEPRAISVPRYIPPNLPGMEIPQAEQQESTGEGKNEPSQNSVPKPWQSKAENTEIKKPEPSRPVEYTKDPYRESLE